MANSWPPFAKRNLHRIVHKQAVRCESDSDSSDRLAPEHVVSQKVRGGRRIKRAAAAARTDAHVRASAARPPARPRPPNQPTNRQTADMRDEPCARSSKHAQIRRSGSRARMGLVPHRWQWAHSVACVAVGLRASAPTFVTNASAVAGQQTSDLAADSALSRPRALVGASCSTAGGRTTCR